VHPDRFLTIDIKKLGHLPSTAAVASSQTFTEFIEQVTAHFDNSLYLYQHNNLLLNNAFVLLVLMQYTAYSLNDLGRFNSERLFSYSRKYELYL
jgi:hypothetical protein